MDLIVMLTACLLFLNGDQICRNEVQASMTECLMKKIEIINKQHAKNLWEERENAGISQVHVWCDLTTIAGDPI